MRETEEENGAAQPEREETGYEGAGVEQGGGYQRSGEGGGYEQSGKKGDYDPRREGEDVGAGGEGESA